MSLSKSLIIISLDDRTDDKTSASKKFLSISKKNIILSLNEVPDHNGKSSAFKVDIGSVDTVNNMISAFIENKGLCRVDIKSENKDS